MTKALEQVAAFVHREIGMVLQDAQINALAGTIERIAPGSDADEFLLRLSDSRTGPSLLTSLVDQITIKETFFLRHLEQLDEIPWSALWKRARAAGAKNVRVWSAACASGEEPYSLALLACEAFGTFAPPITILATDVSALALARARAAEYGARSTRELDAVRRQRHFQAADDRLVANDHVRSMVTFAQHNLVTGEMPPRGEERFDLILCRNVLIYFDERTVEHVLHGLHCSLAPGGRLILGAADALARTAGRLRAIVQDAPIGGLAELRRPLVRTVVDERDGSSSPSASEYFLAGLAELEAADPEAAVASLRRALYSDPGFGMAAFQLARAYEALGNMDAACRAYEQTLRTFKSARRQHHEALSERITRDDILVATRSRLDALAAAGIGTATGR
jgi:chemotaxis protein methyltransferase CheR